MDDLGIGDKNGISFSIHSRFNCFYRSFSVKSDLTSRWFYPDLIFIEFFQR